MQKGSVDVLKQLRQARSRLDKAIKFIEREERRERKRGAQRLQDELDQQEARKCDPYEEPESTKTAAQESFAETP